MITYTVFLFDHKGDSVGVHEFEAPEGLSYDDLEKYGKRTWIAHDYVFIECSTSELIGLLQEVLDFEN